MGKAMGTDTESPPTQASCIFPGHWPNILRFQFRLEAKLSADSLQPSVQHSERQLFQSFRFQAGRTMAERTHDGLVAIKPKRSPARQKFSRDVKDRRHPQTFQFRRGLGGIAAL